MGKNNTINRNRLIASGLAAATLLAGAMGLPAMALAADAPTVSSGETVQTGAVHIGLNKDKTKVTDIQGLKAGEWTLGVKNPVTDGKLTVTITDKDGNAKYTATLKDGKLAAKDKDGKDAATLTLADDDLVTVSNIGAGFEFNPVTAPTPDKPDTTAQPVTIDLSQVKGSGYGIYVNAAGSAPQKDDNKTPLYTVWGSLKPGDWTVTYQQPQADNASPSVTFTHNVNAKYDAATGVIALGDPADKSVLSVKDPSSTAGDPDKLDLHVDEGDVLLLPGSDDYTHGIVTFTPKNTTGGDNGGTDNNNGNGDNNNGGSDNNGSGDNNNTDKPAATTYDIDLSKTQGSIGMVAALDTDQVPSEGIAYDASVRIAPAVYDVTYTSDEANLGTPAAVGTWYSASTINDGGKLGSAIGAKYENVSVAADWYKPTDGSKPVTTLRLTMPRGSYVNWTSGKNHGILHLVKVADVDDSTNGADQNQTTGTTDGKDTTGASKLPQTGIDAAGLLAAAGITAGIAMAGMTLSRRRA